MMKKFVFENFIEHEPYNGPRDPIVEIKEVFHGFTEEELHLVHEEAFSKGLEKGYADALEDHKNGAQIQIAQILENIKNGISELMVSRNELEKMVIEVSKTIIQKVFPHITDEHGSKSVASFIENSLCDLLGHTKLIIKVSKDLFEDVKSEVEKNLFDKEILEKIQWVPSSDLENTNAQILWNGGGIEFSPSSLMGRIEQKMHSYTEGEEND